MNGLTRVAVIVSISVAAFLGAMIPASYSSGQYLSTLLYHRFEEPEHATTNISKQRFEEQMQYLRDNQYHVASLEEVAASWNSGNALPEKSVFITIDDAYRSTYEVAFPILKRYGYPFTVYVSSRSIQQSYSDMLTVEQLLDMKKAGVSFGNHTHTHPHLAVPDSAMSELEYRSWVQGEIKTCKDFLEKYGLDNTSFAFPYGEYNQIVIEEAHALGYELMLSQNPGNASYPLKQESVLPRQAITGQNMNIALFRERLDSPPLLLGSRTPEAGFLRNNTPQTFAAQLLEPSHYRPGIINMFVSEWGALDASFDVDTGWIQASNNLELSRAVNRIIITAKEAASDHFAFRSWLICLPPPWEDCQSSAHSASTSAVSCPREL